MKYILKFAVSTCAVLALFLFFGAQAQAATTSKTSPHELWTQKTAGFDPDLFSGGATYEMPIEIPSGRSGMQPKINLNYHSQNRDDSSMVGYGWRLGIDKITRKNSTGILNLYSDGVFTLELNGHIIDLEDISLSSGEYGTYGASVEGDFLQIEFNSDGSWTVTSKEGIEYTFGSSTDSRVDNPDDSTQIFAWYLEEARDLNDNFVSYSYYKDGSVLYPAEINYTGHGSSNGPFTVRFEPFASGTPSTRDDATTKYNTGFALEYNYLLESIEIDVDGQTSPVLSYDLSYSTGDNGYRTLLASVTKSGLSSDGSIITLPATEFSYTQATDSWSDASSSFSFSEKNYGTQGVALADFTGDGVVDVYQSDSGGGSSISKSMHNGAEQGFTDTSSDWTLPEVDLYGPNTIVADFNNDGFVDMARSNCGSACQQWVYLNNKDRSFTEVSSSWSMPSFDFKYRSVSFGDINGDGLLDIVYQEGCYHGSCLASYVYEGDGETGWHDKSSSYTLPVLTITESVRLIDVNADGLADFWQSIGSGMGSAEGKLYINNGDGTFTEATTDWDWTVPPAPFNLGGTQTQDVNGDGLVDIYKAESSGAASVWLNTGHDWEKDSSFTTSAGGTNVKERKFMDFNGDGLMDGVYEECSYGCSGSAFIHDGEKPDLLSEITTPQGGTVTFTYESSAQLKNDDGDTVNNSLPLVFPVVTTLKKEDGLGNSDSIEFLYENGAYESSTVYDGKFAGFGKSTKIYDDGSYISTYYHQGGGEDGSALGEYEDHYDMIGKAYRKEYFDENGDALKAQIYGWTRYDIGDGRSYVKLFKELELDYNPDGTWKAKGKRYEYDSYGNVSKLIDLGEVLGWQGGNMKDTGDDKIVTRVAYVSTTSPYLVGLPYRTVKTDQNGDVISVSVMRYDGEPYGSATKGNLTANKEKISDSDGFRVSGFYYNKYGNLLSQTDPNGNVTKYRYNSYNLYPKKVIDALLYETLYEYDIVTGNVSRVVDPNGAIREWDYDSFGRLESERVSDVDDSAVLVTVRDISYNNSSAPNYRKTVLYSDSASSTESYEFSDGFGRIVQTRAPLENGNYAVIDIAYNEDDGVIWQSLPYENSGSSYSGLDSSQAGTETTYDRTGRVLTAKDGVGTVTYDYENWSETVTDENGNEKTYYYDSFGRLIQVDENESGSTYSTFYTYDANGNLTKLIDSAGNIRDFTYDMLGQRTSATELYNVMASSYGTWEYTYDNAGNLESKIDPAGTITTYSYDALNRIELEDNNNTSAIDIIYTYDSATNGIGKIGSALRDAVQTEYAYNARGGIATVTRNVGDSYDTSYEYDYLDRVIEKTYPNGLVLYTTYNDQGLIESLELGPDMVVSDVDYNANNQPILITYGNGVTTANEFDSSKRYWITGIETLSGSDTLQSLSYSYDSVGNITEITDASDVNTAMMVSYEYDNLNRLVSAVSSGSSAGDYSYSYAYDSIGNLTEHPTAGILIYGGPFGSYPHAVIDVNGTVWTYDDNGNVESDGSNVYSWTYRNELESILGALHLSEYSYDHNGDRVQKEVDGNVTVYIDDYIYNKSDLTEEIHLVLNGKPVFMREIEPDGTAVDNFIHTDHLGSVAVMTDSAGAWTRVRDYYPYGSERLNEQQGTGSENRFDYTNKERDSESGLSYFEARYMNSDLGRFMSRDPAVINFSNKKLLKDPQIQNAYSYARDNPLKYTDPDGEFVLAAIAIGYTAFEVTMTAIDIYDAVTTTLDPNASTLDKALSIGGLAAGVLLPGGGYSKIDDVVDLGIDAIKSVNRRKNGWRVGESLLNNTRMGNVPSWSAIRQRYWKNEAYYKPSHYTEKNLKRMRKGRAKQGYDPGTGKWSSVELHHDPPQREGGLFNFKPMWPSDHADLDPLRKLKK